jgi:tetratricopeptide (TPR) repeat protein
MKIREAACILIGVLFSLLSGFVLTELSLRLTRGSPRQALERNNLTYAYFEVYNDFFAMKKDENGNKIYETRRINIDRQSFPVKKAPGTIRIFILGESTAYCFGQSKDQFVEVLRRRLPGCNAEILNCGLPALDITRILPVFREIMHYAPDMVLLFAGNNICNPEIEMPDGLTRTLYMETWVYRLLDGKYMEKRTRYGNAADFLETHRKALKEMAAACRAEKIPLILYTLPTNIRNFPLTHSPNPIPARKLKKYFLARMAMDSRRYADAVRIFDQLIAEGQDKNIYVLFYKARCLEALGNYSEAGDFYSRVLRHYPLLGLENCLTTRKNEITREIARKEGVLLVDLVRMFMDIAPHGLIGDECLWDYCHWWKAYNRPIFEETLNKVSSHNEEHPGESLITFRDLKPGGQAGMREAMAEAFRDYSKNADYYFYYAMSNILGGNAVPDQPIDYLKKCLALDPDLLRNTLNMKKEIYSRVSRSIWIEALASRIDATWPSVLWVSGEAYRQAGEYEKALLYFNKSVESGKDELYPYLYRGLAHLNMGEKSLAENDWKKVIGKDSDYSWLKEVLGRNR